MSCRHGRVLPALVLGLLTPLGCTRWQNCVPQMIVAQHPAVPSTGTGDLSPAQAAQLCLTAGEALEKKGFTTEALGQYENARKHDPNAPGVARHLAVLYDLQGDAASAEREYQRALKEQPHNAELLNDFGYFHYRHNHLQTAESWLRNATAADPNCVCAWTNLGQVLAVQGRAEESYEAFTHALPPAEAYSNLGILLAKQGRTAEARKALQQAVKLNPQLMQPRAFLSALGDVPGPLPPGLTHNPPPASPPAVKPADTLPPVASHRVERAKPPAISRPAQVPQMPPEPVHNDRSASTRAVKRTAPLPPVASNRVDMVKPIPPASSQPPQMQWMPPNRKPAVPASSRPAAVSSPSPTLPSHPMTVSAERPDLPVIVNGPIQPKPISSRPSSAPSPEEPVSMKTSMAPLHRTPPLPPPAPPSPPPLALLASGGSAEEPTLIRTSAVTTQLPGPKPSPAATTPPPQPLPASLAPKPLPASLPTTVQPHAVLTDCQGEHEAEHEQ